MLNDESPYFHYLPQWNCVTQFPHLFVWLFCCSNCKKETLFEVGKYERKPQSLEMSQAQSNARAALSSFAFLFARFQVENSLSSLAFMNYFLALGIFSVLIKPVHKKAPIGHPCQACSCVIAAMEVPPKHPWNTQRCQSLHLAPSQDSCHCSSFIMGTFHSLHGVPCNEPKHFSVGFFS